MNTAPFAADAGLSRRRGVLDLLAAVGLGGLHSLSVVHTEAWWLQPLTLGALVWCVGRASPWRAAALGMGFGTAWLAASIWWLFISMHSFGGLPAWMAALAVLLLSAFMALFLAAAMGAFARWRRGFVAADALLFGAVWLLAELARGALFTGFPWAASGYAHVDGPLAALAPWLGVYGIGFVSAALAAALALPRGGGWWAWAAPGVVAVAALTAAAVAGPAQFTQANGTLRVSLLQGNVPQDEKFSLAHLPEALAWTREQLLAAQGELVLGPETVIPLLPAQLDPAYWDSLLAHFRQGRQAALVGLPLGDEQLGYTNSVAGISAASASQPGGFYRYDKHHLVPFGEFIPFGFRWFTAMMNIPLGDFNRGALIAPSFQVQAERVAPNVCYEDLFGEELAARFADAARAPTILANISNIGWFGETIAVTQHLNISRMRTLELQRPMLRATNTGATVVIDHRGRVVHALKPHTQGVLEGSVQGRIGLTPFAWWASRFGLWLPLLLALGLILIVLRWSR